MRSSTPYAAGLLGALWVAKLTVGCVEQPYLSEADAPAGSAECAAPVGMGSPNTVEDAIALVNALPRPVDAACVVAALDRPLRVAASSGMLSAQPAAGPHDPRVFLFSGDLTLSVATAGPGRNLLEFGQRIDDGSSLKAELHLPITAPVDEARAYDHLRYNDELTVCGFCHPGERRAPGVDHPNAYVSQALRPADKDVVSLTSLRETHAACDVARTPDRCRLLRAIFDHGAVEAAPFDTGWPTIYDR